MSNDNVVIGTTKKIEGSAESAFGTITGNKATEFKGDAKRVLGSAQNAFGKAENCVRDSIDTATTEIHKKPVQSALIALGVGFLLGKLFSL